MSRTNLSTQPSAKTISALLSVCLSILFLSTGTFGGSRGGEPETDSKGAPCSVAVVSRSTAQFPSRERQGCDTTLARNMVRRGNGFKQSEQGMESILALGPGYGEKDALRWFLQAAQRGSAPAQVNLAVMYSNGWGTASDVGAALHWLHAAADQHFARAYYNLGFLYMNGHGVRQDYGEAFRWFQKGAEAGDGGSQVNLGYLFDQGLGCSRNVKEAAAWYRKASDAGTPLAQNDLADLYARGEGVEQNTAEAFRLFEKAAQAGVTGARIKLGYMYGKGMGTTKNPEAAYAWITAATLAGDRRGEYMLPNLELLLTPQQLTSARQRAVELAAAQAPEFSANARLP